MVWAVLPPASGEPLLFTLTREPGAVEAPGEVSANARSTTATKSDSASISLYGVRYTAASDFSCPQSEAAGLPCPARPCAGVVSAAQPITPVEPRRRPGRCGQPRH